MDAEKTIRALVHQATVWIHRAPAPGRPAGEETQDPWGSGFFVAPGRVLTCAHIFQRGTGWAGDAAFGVSYRVGNRQETTTGRLKHALPGPTEEGRGPGSWPLPDLAVVELAHPVDHPCLWLTDLSTPPTSGSGRLLLQGFAPDGNDSVQPWSGDCMVAGQSGAAFRLGGQAGEIEQGVSGGPIVDLSRAAVVGVIKARRNDGDGGLGVPLTGLRALPSDGAGQDPYQELFAGHDRWHWEHHCAAEPTGPTWADVQQELLPLHRLWSPVDRAEALALLAKLPPAPDTGTVDGLVRDVIGDTVDTLSPLPPRAWRDGAGLLYDPSGKDEVEAVLTYLMLVALLAAEADGETAGALQDWALRRSRSLPRTVRRKLSDLWIERPGTAVGASAPTAAANPRAVADTAGVPGPAEPQPAPVTALASAPEAGGRAGSAEPVPGPAPARVPAKASPAVECADCPGAERVPGPESRGGPAARRDRAVPSASPATPGTAPHAEPAVRTATTSTHAAPSPTAAGATTAYGREAATAPATGTTPPYDRQADTDTAAAGSPRPRGRRLDGGLPQQPRKRWRPGQGTAPPPRGAARGEGAAAADPSEAAEPIDRGAVVLELRADWWSEWRYAWSVRLVDHHGGVVLTSLAEGRDAVDVRDLTEPPAGLSEALRAAFLRADAGAYLAPFEAVLPQALFDLPVDEWLLGAANPRAAHPPGAARSVIVRDQESADRAATDAFEPGCEVPLRWTGPAPHSSSRPLIAVPLLDPGRTPAPGTVLTHCGPVGAGPAGRCLRSAIDAGETTLIWSRTGDPAEDRRFHLGVADLLASVREPTRLPGAVAGLRAGAARGDPRCGWAEGIALLHHDPDRRPSYVPDLLDTP
ncbi:VMAP-C domain-containing protein [Streptomyces puniciscabiei]